MRPTRRLTGMSPLPPGWRCNPCATRRSNRGDRQDQFVAAVFILPDRRIFAVIASGDRRNLIATGTVWVSLRSNSLRVIVGPDDFPGSLVGDSQIRHVCADPGSPSQFPAPLLPVAA